MSPIEDIGVSATKESDADIPETGSCFNEASAKQASQGKKMLGQDKDKTRLFFF